MCTRWPFALLCALSCLSFSGSTAAQTPEWIWHPETNAPSATEQLVYFRKTFRTPPLLWNARLTVAADDSAEVFLNGVSVARCEHWNEPIRTEVTVRLNQGENVLGVRARNANGPAGLLVQLGLGGSTNVVSDASWLVSTNLEENWSALAFNAGRWTHARTLGPPGIEPWGNVFLRASATAVEALQLLPGFKAELLRSAQPGEGSWICMAFDDRGRLIISPEKDERPLIRLTFEAGQVSKIEPLCAPVHDAMGLLWAHDSLYLNARGPEGPGLYRLKDHNHNDQFETNELHFLARFNGGSEHGYHAVRLGPDGRVYVMNGNGTKLPERLSWQSPYRNYAQDVLSVNPDETTEAGKESAVQGYLLRSDFDGTGFELWAGGFRNAYAFDISPDGELFTFDSDMEWDWGTPWYRPTRLLHVIAGAEFGWRDGTRTWPDYYEDSLPPVLDIGIGSPTGVRFPTGSRFPEKYRRALFLMDWSYGRILVAHLKPRGASYSATVENFVQGTPLNLTDLTFGPDGALYFITGGRATQSGLYRVTYEGALPGPAPGEDAPAALEDTRQARALRRQLESLCSRREPAAVDIIWPHLDSADRFIRYAARVALEFQEVGTWKERALAERRPTGGLVGLLALARVGGPETQSALLQTLGRFPLNALSQEQQLLKLRVLQVSLLRQGHSDPALAQVRDELAAQFPAQSWPLNRELSRLLIFLEAPKVVSKTVELLDKASTQPEQFHYVAQLRNVRTGWTLTDRRRFFQWWLKPRQNLPHPPELDRWFADVGRRYVDGAWVDRYLREFRTDAIATLSPSEREALSSVINAPWQKAQLVPASNRPFVREWTMSDLLPALDQAQAGRSFERGRQAFVDAQCITCHRLGNDGGSVGPELTGAADKYDRRSLLESILEPSKVINEQYQNVSVFLKDGDSYTGRIVRENDEQLIVETDPLSGAREAIKRAAVDRVVPSKLSPMPEGLANVLSRDEILDLIAYLQARGDPAASAFQQARK